MHPATVRALLAVASVAAFASGAAQSPPSHGLIPIASERELGEYLTSITVPNPACVGKATVTQSMASPTARDTGMILIRGRAMAESGAPLNGAQVYLERFNLGTVTHEDGRYHIIVPSVRVRRGDTIRVTAKLIGYRFIDSPAVIVAQNEIGVDFAMCSQPLHFDETPPEGMSDAGSEPVRNSGYEDVEDGDIVKTIGDVIVILHRGHLFTVRIGDGSMKRVSMVNVSTANDTAWGTWYQIYVAGKRIVAVGETLSGDMPINVFDVDSAGRLALRESYVWGRSDKTPSQWRTAAVVGGKLVLYHEQVVRWRLPDPLMSVPVLRRAKSASDGAPAEIVETRRRFYRATGMRPAGGASALHSVASCDLAAKRLRCDVVSVVGPEAEQVYLAKTAAYAWLSDSPRCGEAPAAEDSSSERALLLRIPFDTSALGTLELSGSPRSAVFEERAGDLLVMVRRKSGADLLRAPIDSFNFGSGGVSATMYRKLPTPAGNGMFGRFIASDLLYGSVIPAPDGKGWRSELFVVPWKGGPITRLDLPYSFFFLHRMGDGAVAGEAVARQYMLIPLLLGRAPRAAPAFAIDSTADGRLPSGGFFYRPDGPGTGLAGLPAAIRANPAMGDVDSASVMFFVYGAARFVAAGQLVSSPPPKMDDACRISCREWFGNARPIFVHGRIFALLGYELIEGELRKGQVVETGRIDLAQGLIAP